MGKIKGLKQGFSELMSNYPSQQLDYQSSKKVLSMPEFILMIITSFKKWTTLYL